ncbi:MAG: GUN4 domain-containing protein [Polyangiales bacterium]
MWRRVDSVLALPEASVFVTASLWDRYTLGRHGLAKQVAIWREVGRDFFAFCGRVGWVSRDADPRAHPGDNFADGRRAYGTVGNRPDGHWPAVVDGWTPMFHDTHIEDASALNVALLCRVEQVLTVRSRS